MEPREVIGRTKAANLEKGTPNLALHALMAVVVLGLLTALWVSLWVPSMPIP